MTDDPAFARLVSLACHDMRTPLATVFGFARTLSRTDGLGEPHTRYVEMIAEASAQLGELIDELGLVARIQAGRYDPTFQEVDTGELARAAAVQLGEDRVLVSGPGGAAAADAQAVSRAVSALVQAALRHGGLEQVELVADGRELAISPVTKFSAPVLLGEAVRDLGASAAVAFLRAIGGSVELDGETLRVRLPVEAASPEIVS